MILQTNSDNVQIIKNPIHNSGLDLFRLLAFLFITILHILNHRYNLLELKNNILYQYILANFFEYLSLCGVNCFALLSGFLLSTKPIDIDHNWIKRILKIWLQIFFYSIGIFLIFNLLLGKPQITIMEIIKYSTPVCSEIWWYMTSYIGLLAVIPIINIALSKTNLKTQLEFSIISLIFFSIIPIFSLKTNLFNLGNGYSFIWLALCYFWGGVIRLNIHKIKLNKKSILIILLGIFISITIPFLFNISFAIMRLRGRGALFSYLSPFVVIEAMLLLILFYHIKIKSEKIQYVISKISGAALGIYLIQSHPLIMKNILRNNSIEFPCSNLLEKILLWLILLFLSGIIFDLLRQWLFKLIKADQFCTMIDKRICLALKNFENNFKL